MVERVFNTIDEVYSSIKAEIDSPNVDPEKSKKVTVIYASNASGKTRLSKIFTDAVEEEVLCYNAYIEDLFAWDNENFSIKIDSRSWMFRLVNEQSLQPLIVDDFKRLTGSSVEPYIDIDNNKISFPIPSNSEAPPVDIKVSRGEESVLIWSVFFNILETAVEALNEKVENRPTDVFNQKKYVLIDDPVSSMDDTRIINIALDIASLIHKSKSDLKFIITTHHPLFFNVLYNSGRSRKNWDRKNYVLYKSTPDLILRDHGHDSPFAYHLSVIDEIGKAIKENEIKKYHFNLFRSLLEKTANFLGYSEWQPLLEDGPQGREFKKLIEHFSHNSLSDLEYKELDNGRIEDFKGAFNFFIEKYKWGRRS